MAKQKTEQAAPAAPKPILSAEERLQLARARHAEDGKALDKRSAALTQKAVAREKMEDEYERVVRGREVALELHEKALADEKEAREGLNKWNAEERRLASRLGLRKRGQAPAEQPPAETPEAAETQASTPGGAADEGGAA